MQEASEKKLTEEESKKVYFSVEITPVLIVTLF